MKRRITIVYLCFASIICCKSQPNPGFENWSQEFTYQEPDGWQTLNFLTMLSPPNPQSAFRANGIEAHSGTSALKLQTVYLNNRPPQLEIGDSSGGAYTGKLIYSPLSVKQGFPYTGRPEKLQFWARYIPIGNDMGRAGVLLKKATQTGYDTVAFGLIYLSETTAYTLFEVELDYKTEELPDSAIIAFGTSKNSATARLGSTLFVDDVAFMGYVGVNELAEVTEKVQLFPNPASSQIHIKTGSSDAEYVRILDSSGKEIRTYTIKNNNLIISTDVYKNGIYFYEIRGKNDLVHRGKLSVVK